MVGVDPMGNVEPGDLYEDAFYHPCLCIGVSGGIAWGVSLIDGNYPRETDMHRGGIRKLTLEEAWSMKQGWAHRR